MAVVIPVRNGATTLATQLEALAGAKKPSRTLEVVVADNGSTDDTRSIAMSFTDRLALRIVDAGEVPGINIARNLGVAATDAEWLLFCDDDDAVD